MSKIIVIDGSRVLAAGDTVELFADFGLVDHEGFDEAGQPVGGIRRLDIHEGMALVEVAELPSPWLEGAYDFAEGLFVLDEESEAYKAYQAQQAEEFEALVSRYDAYVQNRLDDVARSFNYGDPNRPDVSPILHAISYAEEPAVPKFQAEGQLLRAWRSLYWAACWPILEAVREGQRPVPEPAALIAELDAAAPPPAQADVDAKIAELTA